MTTTNTNLPTADQDIAHHRELELHEAASLRKEVCRTIGNFRAEAKAFGHKTISIINEARGIGFLILKSVEALPGKKMTIDFWKQQQNLYRDQHGQPILLEQLEWFMKVARDNPEPVEDIQRALSYRKDIVTQGNFQLESDTPGMHIAEPKNNFNSLQNLLFKATNELRQIIIGLEADQEHFGPVKGWNAERKQIVLLKVQPLKESIDSLYLELNEGI
jgi:hypothetical protein